MAETYQDMLARLRRELAEVTVEEANAIRERAEDVVLLDVREQDEWNEGHVPGAIHIPRGFLELRVEDAVPDRDKPVIAYCAGGVRSLFAEESLRNMGYTNVSSMEGGFGRWKNQGLPFEKPRVLSDHDRMRYARHLSIPEVGEEGQLKLLDSKVLLVGAGGLGCPAAQYLAAAGVGTLGIVDFDVVDETNLQRQILHPTSRVGMLKTESARKTLLDINPGITINTYDVHLDSSNVVDIFGDYDVIVDGSDNFPTRYLVNDACVYLKKPNVHGSIFRFDGQATIFWPGVGPCYRCLYPEPPPPELAPSCAEAGVLGVLPGVIGVLEAIEVIKIILEKGDLLVGRLLVYDALEAGFTELRLERDPGCRYCADGVEFPGFIDYEWFCSAHADETQEQEAEAVAA